MKAQFIKFGERYSKDLGNGCFLVVDDWGHSKNIEWVLGDCFDPRGNPGWEEISEQEFNEAYEKVLSLLSPDRMYLADVFQMDVGADQQLANAKLMAAAPELLEACIEMVKHLEETDFDVCGTPDSLMNKWKAAITKATT